MATRMHYRQERDFACVVFGVRTGTKATTMSKKQAKSLPIDRRSLSNRCYVMRARVVSTVVTPLSMTSCFALLDSGKQTDTVGAKVEGTILVTDSEGKPSLVAAAGVKLTSPVTCDTLRGETGKDALAARGPASRPVRLRGGEKLLHLRLGVGLVDLFSITLIRGSCRTALQAPGSDNSSQPLARIPRQICLES